MDERAQSVLMAIRRILRAAEQDAKRLSRNAGLTASQMLALQWLQERREATAGDMAAALGITQATTTSLLHRLLDRGLIERRRGDSDRRQVWLTLPDDGRAAVARAPTFLHARFVERFGELEPWEQAMLVAALERVATLLDADRLDAAPMIVVGALAPGETNGS
ncbi:MAG: MarR family transcriptional regulator [Pseudomonadota bacterium]|nr:MarR family transcriptional regulator [Pseudomonadota bacterium]